MKDMCLFYFFGSATNSHVLLNFNSVIENTPFTLLLFLLRSYAVIYQVCSYQQNTMQYFVVTQYVSCVAVLCEFSRKYNPIKITMHLSSNSVQRTHKLQRI